MLGFSSVAIRRNCCTARCLLDLVSFLHSDSLLFLGRKINRRPIMAASLRVATFYDLPGNLPTTAISGYTCVGTGSGVTAAGATGYSACVATGTSSCQLTLPFAGSATTDSYSAPFYDYANDAMYVGDDTGVLHKFSPMFNGLATEVVTNPQQTTAGWPTKMATRPLFNPVADTSVTTPEIFVTEETYGVSSAYLLSTTASGGGTGASTGITVSLPMGTSSGVGIYTGPVLDSGSGTLGGDRVYVFDSDEGDNTCSFAPNGTNQSAVFQFPANFSGSTALTGVNVDCHFNEGFYILPGDFDNAFYTKASPTTAAGSLYLIGATNSNLSATLYQIAISSTASWAGTVNAGPVVTQESAITGPIPYSPITEFYQTRNIAGSVSGSTLTLTTGSFSGGDIGAQVSGTGISGTPTITAVTNSTTATLSAAQTSGAVTATIADDWIYFSVELEGGLNACNGSCLYSLNVLGLTLGTGTANYNGRAVQPGGTSGIVIDNGATSTGASQIYFSSIQPTGAAQGGWIEYTSGTTSSGAPR